MKKVLRVVRHAVPLVLPEVDDVRNRRLRLFDDQLAQIAQRRQPSGRAPIVLRPLEVSGKIRAKVTNDRCIVVINKGSMHMGAQSAACLQHRKAVGSLITDPNFGECFEQMLRFNA